MNSLPSSVERENLGQILLENLQEITDKPDKIVTDSDRIILDNLLQETKILLDRVKYNSKTYQARADIFGQINQLWLQVCKQYRDEDSALELIRIGKARNNHNAKPKRFCNGTGNGIFKIFHRTCQCLPNYCICHPSNLQIL